MSTPTKAAEIREALDFLKGELQRHSDLQIAPSLSISIALDEVYALLADMEREGERVRYGTAPGLKRNCSVCDFLSTPSESKHFRYCPGCGWVIEHPSPTTATKPFRP